MKWNYRKRTGSDSENRLEKEQDNGLKFNRVQVWRSERIGNRDCGLFQVDLITQFAIAKSNRGEHTKNRIAKRVSKTLPRRAGLRRCENSNERKK